MEEKKESHSAVNRLMTTVMIGNIVVGAVVIVALITLENGLCLLGLLALPSLWTRITFRVGGDKDDK